KVEHWGANNPGKCYAHSAVVVGNEMLLFGGSNKTLSLNELYSFHFPTGFWKKIQFNDQTIPVKRVYFPTWMWNGKWIIFGGLSDGFACSDIWMLECKYACPQTL